MPRLNHNGLCGLANTSREARSRKNPTQAAIRSGLCVSLARIAVLGGLVSSTRLLALSKSFHANVPLLTPRAPAIADEPIVFTIVSSVTNQLHSVVHIKSAIPTVHASAVQLPTESACCHTDGHRSLRSHGCQQLRIVVGIQHRVPGVLYHGADLGRIASACHTPVWVSGFQAETGSLGVIERERLRRPRAATSATTVIRVGRAAYQLLRGKHWS
mmetsp:Transcript_92885/g.248540  ORF Transcript_92885/g.248540 Transcript_92885/m.248540 type:complete len:215 (+) Transcript_92885:128-772(+)